MIATPATEQGHRDCMAAAHALSEEELLLMDKDLVPMRMKRNQKIQNKSLFVLALL